MELTLSNVGNEGLCIGGGAAECLMQYGRAGCPRISPTGLNKNQWAGTPRFLSQEWVLFPVVFNHLGRSELKNIFEKFG